MSDQYFVKTLYPFQDQVINTLNSIQTEFYLPGETAASRGYLNHRYSDDLDFIVNDDERFQLWADRSIQALSDHPDWETDILLRQERYVRLELQSKDVTLKVEFLNAVPARVGDITEHKLLG